MLLVESADKKDQLHLLFMTCWMQALEDGTLLNIVGYNINYLALTLPTVTLCGASAVSLRTRTLTIQAFFIFFFFFFFIILQNVKNSHIKRSIQIKNVIDDLRKLCVYIFCIYIYIYISTVFTTVDIYIFWSSSDAAIIN